MSTSVVQTTTCTEMKYILTSRQLGFICKARISVVSIWGWIYKMSSQPQTSKILAFICKYHILVDFKSGLQEIPRRRLLHTHYLRHTTIYFRALPHYLLKTRIGFESLSVAFGQLLLRHAHRVAALPEIADNPLHGTQR